MERIDKHRCFLQERIDPDNGLLMKLRSFSLPFADISAVKARSSCSFIERNHKIIDIVLKRCEYILAFLRSLSETGQQHLVNYLKSDGENVENTDDWPLTCRETKLIDSNYDVLTRVLVADDLLAQLYSKHVITMEQKDTITSNPTDLQRNDVLLEILRRRSLRDYIVMITVLRESNCGRAANILEGKEVPSSTQLSSSTPGELLSIEHVWSLETGAKNSIWGVGCLKNIIYVLSKKNQLILAFEAEVPFGLSTEIPIPQVAVPRDMAACEMNNCLYVVDDESRYVWKIAIPELKMNRWLSDINKPFKISVTKDGRLLISREGRPCVIEVMGSDAILERRIELPDEIKDIEYAVQSPRETFIVSYGRNRSRNRGVWEISEEGSVLKTHFLPPEIWSEMKDPRHMTFGRGDRLFVADCRNDRVIVFDSQLHVKQVLLSKLENSINSPYRVCYNEDRNYLIVVHSFGYKVVVYKCS